MATPGTVAPVGLDLGPYATTQGLDLSGAAVHGDALFVAPDEGTALLRLTRTAAGWGEPVPLPLEASLDLPGKPGGETDAEGLDLVDGCLWVVGSHSAKRRRVVPGTPATDVGTRLGRVSTEKSRRLLARVPLVDAPDGNGSLLAGRDDDVPGPGLPTRLPGGRRGLHGALAADEHLGPFLGIPGKDNGFDVEGIAVRPDGVVLLGLRGPVLRGWAVVLGVSLKAARAELVLEGVTKHFLDLDGLGVRDLARHGDDLLVLAGPTMALDGPARVYRVPGAVSSTLPPSVARSVMELVAELPVGAGVDKPEGLAVLPEGLLVLHDSPAPQRWTGTVLRADLLPM